MKQHLYLIIAFISILCGCTRNQNNIWVTTNEGYKIFIPAQDSAFQYSWKGDNFDSLCNGQGYLYKYHNGELIDSSFMIINFGSTNGNQKFKVEGDAWYIGEIKDNLFDGYGVLKQNDDLYIGFFQDGEPHGELNFYTNNILQYSGEWSYGQINGYGISYAHGKTTRGIWKNGKIVQAEVKIRTNIGIYYGLISDGKRNGHGTMLFNNGNIYDGNWTNGKPNGEGTAFFSDSSIYKGNWTDGSINGQGEIVFSNGDSYKGTWENGKPCGNGVFTSSIGRCEGIWENGSINGDAKIKYNNGDVYTGPLKNNKRIGQGTYNFANGNSFEGEFEDDTFQGLGVFSFKDGNKYEGCFAFGRMLGEGTLYYYGENDTVLITAYWEGSNELPHYASMFFANGDLYVGELKDGIPTGNGKWSNVIFKDRNLLLKANDYYLAHKTTINNVIKYTKYATMAVTTIAVVASGAGAAALPELLKAEENIFNGAETAINIASDGLSLAESIDQDYEIDKATTDILYDGAMVAAGKVINKKFTSSRMASSINNPTAQTAKDATKQLVIKIAKSESEEFVKQNAHIKNHIDELVHDHIYKNQLHSELYQKIVKEHNLKIYLTVVKEEGIYKKKPMAYKYFKSK